MLSPSPVAGRSEALPPPPAYIRFPQGAISYASQVTSSPFAGKRTYRSGAQKAGLAYQRKVEAWLSRTCVRDNLLCGPWFCYSDRTGRRSYCQPDVLIFSPGSAFDLVSVVEIKLRWTSDAWWQLNQLYLPVLTTALPGKKFSRLVICKSYDPAVRVGEPVNLVDLPEEADPSKFNVMVWKHE